jgi:ankyrin repeat protein
MHIPPHFLVTALRYLPHNSAAQTSDYEDNGIAKLLLEEDGIDFNARETCGKTALFLAAEAGHSSMVETDGQN